MVISSKLLVLIMNYPQSKSLNYILIIGVLGTTLVLLASLIHTGLSSPQNQIPIARLIFDFVYN